MSEFVTVNVKPKTKERLKDRGKKDESYDKIVNQLIDDSDKLQRIKGKVEVKAN